MKKVIFEDIVNIGEGTVTYADESISFVRPTSGKDFLIGDIVTIVEE